MELKVFRDTVAAYGGRWETRLELPVETELMIPDYLPAVFKIVKCLIRPVLLQNRVTGAQWNCEGYLRCTVYYQSEEEGAQLCRAEQKFPFEKVAELPKGQYLEGAPNTWGETEYCNCRAINERRIDLRGAYALSVAVQCVRPVEIISSLAECGIEQRVNTLHGWQWMQSEDRIITSESSVELPGAGETVLDIDGDVSGEPTVLAGRVNWRGALSVQICYRIAGNGEIHAAVHSIETEQTLELEQAAEGQLCLCWGEVLSAALTAAEGSRQTTMSIQWRLHVELWNEKEYMAVRDAYSTRFAAEVQAGEIRLLQRQEMQQPQVRAELEDELPQPEAEVRGCFVELGPMLPAAGPEEDTVVLTGRGTAHVICADARGELTCYDKAFSWQLPQQWQGTPAQFCANIAVALKKVSSGREAGRLRVTAELEVRGALFRICTARCVGEVTLGEEYADKARGPALYLYFPLHEECIFDIAKRYHARAGDIAQANHLEAEPGQKVQELCTGAGCLLVPAAL